MVLYRMEGITISLNLGAQGRTDTNLLAYRIISAYSIADNLNNVPCQDDLVLEDLPTVLGLVVS
jgi:hypothetical protein